MKTRNNVVDNPDMVDNEEADKVVNNPPEEVEDPEDVDDASPAEPSNKTTDDSDEVAQAGGQVPERNDPPQQETDSDDGEPEEVSAPKDRTRGGEPMLETPPRNVQRGRSNHSKKSTTKRAQITTEKKRSAKKDKAKRKRGSSVASLNPVITKTKFARTAKKNEHDGIQRKVESDCFSCGIFQLKPASLVTTLNCKNPRKSSRTASRVVSSS